jgi:hypothetical protein
MIKSMLLAIVLALIWNLIWALRRIHWSLTVGTPSNRLQTWVSGGRRGRKKEAHIHVRIVSHAAGDCPICSQTGGTQACPSCGVTHHEDCWKWNGQCGIYGCQTRVV